MDINYGICAAALADAGEDGLWLNLVHFVGYEEPPTVAFLGHVREELKTDPEFGLTQCADQLIIFMAPPEIVQHFKKSKSQP